MDHVPGVYPGQRPVPGLSNTQGTGAATAIPLCTTAHEGIVLGDADGDIVWTDPATGETFIVDGRTGNSYPQHAPGPMSIDTTAIPVGGPRRTLDACPSSATAEPPAWITEALHANESYRLTERRIPAVARSMEVGHRCLESHRYFPSKQADTEAPSFVPWDTSHVARFRREDLGTARVLGQVDRKFIACVMRPRPPDRIDDGDSPDGSGGRALVLIDQHAADERIRVERFLKELCEGFLSSPDHSGASDVPGVQGQGSGGHAGGAQTRMVDPPVHVLLTKVESERIARSQDVRRAFARWGVRFAEAPVPRRVAQGAGASGEGEEGAAYVQVAVAGVPEVVADKVRTASVRAAACQMRVTTRFCSVASVR